MTLSLEPESRLRKISRWGLESGSLRAAAIISVELALLVLASALVWQPGFRFDPAALGVTFCALELGLLRGLLAAVIIGYLADLFSGGPLGLWMFGAAFGYAVLRLFVFRVVGARAPTVALLSGVAALVGGLGRAGLELLFDTAPPSGGLRFVGLVLGSTALGYPSYVTFRWASDRFRKRDDQAFR